MIFPVGVTPITLVIEFIHPYWGSYNNQYNRKKQKYL